MNREKKKNFKKNCIDYIWETATNSWVTNLFYDNDIKFFEKHKLKNLYNFIQKIRFLIKRKPVISTLEYVVTTRCTMNCKLCNTFVPYFTNETHSKIVTFEEFKNDLDKILKSVDYIYCFGFVGGEPFLAKDLAKMIKYACSKKQIKHVFIATNCTILPSQELLDAMKSKKFIIRTSNYTNVKNIKGGVTVKYEEVKKLIKKNKIRLSDPQEMGNTWITAPELYKDSQNPEKLTKDWDNCQRRFCNMLCEGVFVPCTAALFMNRNMELTQEIKDESPNIREFKSSKELTEKFIEIFSKPYSDYCNYCHTENTQYGLPCGEQVE